MKKLFTSLATIAGIVALAGLVLPFVQIIGSNGEDAYQGWKVAIGYKKSVYGVKVEAFKFSILNSLPFLLVLIGAGSLQKGGASAFFAAICFGAAAYLFYKAPSFLEFGELFTILSGEDELRKMFELSKFGNIAMYASGGAAACALVSVFMPD